jgi:hypothetical protein
MNSSEFMLNNQVYTQKTSHKNETQTKAIINFWSKKEAYNFVLFINVEIMFVICAFRRTKVQMYSVDTQGL